MDNNNSVSTLLKGFPILRRALTIIVGVVAIANMPSALASVGRPSRSTPSPSINTVLDNATTALQADRPFLNSELFSVGGYGDTTLGFVLTTKAATYLGSSQQQAAALELDGGSNLVRVNVTYGLALAEHHRFKVTYERLDEQLDFNFQLPGADVREWVWQNAVGGAYAYMFNNAWLESLDMGGFYTHSQSKRLSNFVLTEGDTRRTEYRRIAGANSGHMYAEAALRLWPYSRLTGGIDYDIVDFDTFYRNRHHGNGDNIHGLGGHVQLEQRLFPTLKATFNTQLLRDMYQYGGSLGWLIPSPRGVQFELAALMDYTDSRVTSRHFYVNGLRFSASFDATKRTYSDLDKHGQKQLLSWVNEPVVRKTEVLAVADSRVITEDCMGGTCTTTNDSDPDGPSLRSFSCPSSTLALNVNDPNAPIHLDNNGKLVADNGWSEDRISDGVDEASVSQANFKESYYDVEEQSSVCVYHVVDQKHGTKGLLDLVNPKAHPLNTNESDNDWDLIGMEWTEKDKESNEDQGMIMCNHSYASGCHFTGD